MSGSEIHEATKSILIELDKLYRSLPNKEGISEEDLKAIRSNADSIQCLAEDIQYFCLQGVKKDGYVVPL